MNKHWQEKWHFASSYTLFKPSGSIALKGSDASYNITMVTDDSDCVTDWYSVTVSGTNVDDLIYTKVKNGYMLSASELKNVRVSATEENYTADTVFSTDYEDAFIYEIDKNTIGVAVDTDNNGSYETTINTKVNSNPTDKPNVITSPMPTNKPSTTTGSTPTEEPDVKTSSKPTEQPNVKESPKPTDVTDTTNSPLAGTVLKDNKNKVLYKVLAQGETVAFYQVNNKKTLKSKSVGTQAFQGIYKKAVIKVPKKQKKAYQKWLRKKGITKKMKIK